MEAAADWLSPIYREMKAGLVAGDYLQADETPIRYLDPDVKGKSQSGWLWTYSQPQGDVVFEWNVSRSREGPREFLKVFRGKLQTDGYGVYESLARERGDELILIGCWAHARRGLHEALGEGRSVAWLVGQIGRLYAVENSCASRTPDRNSARPCARGKADPSWSDFAGHWKSCAESCCPRVCSARPLIIRSLAGPP